MIQERESPFEENRKNDAPGRPATPRDFAAKLREIQDRRQEGEHRVEGSRSNSMAGLRLGSVLAQIQALQAIQGLQELAPKRNGIKRRYEFSENETERASQRQWLQFKADWLEALLEETVEEMEALDEFEKDRTAAEDEAPQEHEKGSAADQDETLDEFEKGRTAKEDAAES